MERIQRDDSLAVAIVLEQLMARYLALAAHIGLNAEVERATMLREGLESARRRSVVLADSDEEMDRLSEQRRFWVSREIQHFFAKFEDIAKGAPARKGSRAQTKRKDVQ